MKSSLSALCVTVLALLCAGCTPGEQTPSTPETTSSQPAAPAPVQQEPEDTPSIPEETPPSPEQVVAPAEEPSQGGRRPSPSARTKVVVQAPTVSVEGIESTVATVAEESPKVINTEEYCAQVYQGLMDQHGKDFSNCMGVVDDSYSCDKNRTDTNLVLIMDSSGSMARAIQGQSRMEIAKKAANEFVGNLKEDINLGMIVYGHKGSTAEKEISCAGIDVVTPLGTGNRTTTQQSISQMKAVGWTPIADSLLKARSILASSLSPTSHNSILLVSDGEETCDGSPASVAGSLAQSDGITVNVIGFDVTGDTEDQLKGIAAQGGGKYYPARTANELSAALKNLSDVACASAPGAWGEGFGSVLSTYLDCTFRLNDESREIYQALTFDLSEEEEMCEPYVRTKYGERETGLRTMIEEADQAGRNKLDNVSPVSDDPFFNQDMSDQMGDEYDPVDSDVWDGSMPSMPPMQLPGF